MPEKHKIYKLKDKTDKYTIQKKDIFNVSNRIIFNMPTGAGKTGLIANFLLRPEFYKKDFQNIYIFSGSKDEPKLKTIVRELELDDVNVQVFGDYDDNVINEIYDFIVEQYKQDLENGEKPEHNLFIFDDLGFKNIFARSKKESAMERLFMNGRKWLISSWILTQTITQISPSCRKNANGLIIGKITNSELEMIERQFNYLKTKKEFMDMVRDHTENLHDFMVVNLTNPAKDIYMDRDFKSLSPKENPKS